LQSRTIEMLDQRGIADRFLAEGQVAQVTGFGGTHFDLTGFPTRHPYGLALWQNHIERILAGWVAELGVLIHRNCELSDVSEDGSGVTVTLADGTFRRARYLVGCDGGRSVVRKAVGIAFDGWDATVSTLIAEIETTQTPELGMRHDKHGTHGIGRVNFEIRDGKIIYADSGPLRVVLTDPAVHTGEPTVGDLQEALIRVYGTDFGVQNPIWLSRFSDAARQASTYRKGRVLLAGDAAHIHSPIGGQGLNTGVQDAINLGWKLGLVVRGSAPESMLDTYHAERHPVAARVLRNTMAQIALTRPGDERETALREVVTDLLSTPEPRARYSGMMSGLSLHYDLGEGHPLLGRRVPDLDLETAEGPMRLYSLLHTARPVMLNLGKAGAIDISSWADRVRMVDARCDVGWELPVLGPVPAPEAVLIRPDGYAAWIGGSDQTGLTTALTTWFGPATA
jgi:3-(3-hydroxy-phenyl)propionate hydroxylase